MNPVRLVISMESTMTPLKKRLLRTSLALGAALCAHAETEVYDIDPAHSWVGFSIRHVFTRVPGFFSKVSGAFTVDRVNLENSVVESVVDVASITTSSALRDEHLRSDKFFDAPQFPVMTFKSNKWQGNGEGLFAVTGELTIHGVTKEVMLKVKSLGFGPGALGTPVSGWELSAVIDRRDYGITAGQGAIGNEVEIAINIEAGLRTPVKTAKQP